MAEAQHIVRETLGFALLSADLRDFPGQALLADRGLHNIWNTSYAAWSGMRRPTPTATIRLSQSYFGADVSKYGVFLR